MLDRRRIRQLSRRESLALDERTPHDAVLELSAAHRRLER
jgi:hypothetical protein